MLKYNDNLQKEHKTKNFTQTIISVSKRKVWLIQDGRGVSESYTNLLQDQSGITTKLQRNHLEKPTELQLARSFTTMDRQKKTLQHNVTGREWGGDMRGLPVLPWVAVEVGYYSGQGVPPEKCGM